MHLHEEQKKPAFERQVAVNEVEDTDSLETFDEEVVKEIVRLSQDTRKNKNIRLIRPEENILIIDVFSGGWINNLFYKLECQNSKTLDLFAQRKIY